MSVAARRFWLWLLVVVAAVAAFWICRGSLFTARIDPGRLVGKSAKQLVADCGRPDMIVPVDDHGQADWLYNQGVMGQGVQVRIRNGTVVRVTRQEEPIAPR